MIITNNFNLPLVFENALKAFDKDYKTGRSGTDFSVTEIIKEPLELYLTNKHYHEISADITDRLWILLGSAIHKILEISSNAETEKRLFYKIGNYNISGQADVIDNGIIQDYKITSKWTWIFKNFDKYERQLNILAYLARKNGYIIDGIQAVLIFRDWAKSEAKRTADYPQEPIKVIIFNMLPDNEIESYIKAKIIGHLLALNYPENINVCSDSARWVSEPVFKVFKKGGKRSQKNFSNYDDAVLFVDGKEELEIIESQKTYKYCNEYCPVRAFCQYNIINEEMENES